MAWNLNIANKQNDYDLYNSITSELIDMYGVTVDYLKVEGQEVDHILNEYTHKKVDNLNTHSMNIMPENAAGFDEGSEDILGKFGFMSQISINFFVSSNNMEIVYDGDTNIPHAVGDLIILPSKKVLEITNIDINVAGVNNMFLHQNTKNVYLIKCKPYAYNQDEISDEIQEHIAGEDNIVFDPSGEGNIPLLDSIFNMDVNANTKKEVNKQNTLATDYDDIFGDL